MKKTSKIIIALVTILKNYMLWEMFIILSILAWLNTDGWMSLIIRHG